MRIIINKIYFLQLLIGIIFGNFKNFFLQHFKNGWFFTPYEAKTSIYKINFGDSPVLYLKNH